MPQELNLNGLWWGLQSAKGVENTTPVHRGLQTGGDFNMVRDEGTEQWSDLTKYGGQTQWVNSLLGNGQPQLEFTPSEGASLLWLQHGTETASVGTDAVQTLTAGTATGGTFNLVFWDGAQAITVAAVPFNVTAAALDTSFEAALAAAGYGANQVTTAGGPLNSTPITVTFNGSGVAKRPFVPMTTVTTNLTGGTGPTITNSTPGVRTKHSFSPGLTSGLYATFVRRVGGTSLTQRHSNVDSRVGGSTIDGSTANKALKITPTVLSLDPFKVIASDPTATLPTGVDLKPFLYTDATSTFTFNGVVLQAQSSFTLTLNENLQPVYGDDAVPYDFAIGAPSATLGLTLIFDAVTVQQWNYLAYGKTTPVAGDRPVRAISSDVTYQATFTQKDSRGNATGNVFKLTIPRLHTPIPDAPGPNPQGGNAEITLAGTILPPGGSGTAYTLDVSTADPAAFAA